MKLGVLTSSRADYGIYLPLLNRLKREPDIDFEIIAFGTHLSRFHGYTLDFIKNDKYHVIHELSSLITNDNEESIATTYGLTVLKFVEFWSKNNFDIVFCLGDRFEMSAAVQAGIPYQIRFAHIHGGETTLGAIDDIYRHQITIASSYHFVTTEVFKNKVERMTGLSENIFNVGSLSLSDIENFKPISKVSFKKKYGLTNQDYILATFHPETVSPQQNIVFAEEMKQALINILSTINVIVTMPNADTLGSVYRAKLHEIKKENPNRIILVENFGKENYFNAIYYAKLLLGNSSSGIIEAASFKKFVINVGDRQKGRIQSQNIINSNFNCTEIVNHTMQTLNKGSYMGTNVYYKGNSVQRIIDVIQNQLK